MFQLWLLPSKFVLCHLVPLQYVMDEFIDLGCLNLFLTRLFFLFNNSPHGTSHDQNAADMVRRIQQFQIEKEHL